MLQTITIAHLTDVHLSPVAGLLPRYWNAKRALGLANWLRHRERAHDRGVLHLLERDIARENPNHIVVTGDLTNLGLPWEHQQALTWLSGLGAEHEVSVIPGNHDAYTRGAESSNRFLHYFGEFTSTDIDTGGSAFPFVRLRGPLAIVGLSSAVSQPPMIAAGEVGKEQIAALEAVLTHPDVKSRTLMLLLHHPVINPPSPVKAFTNGLRDADALLHALRNLERGLLVHGHLHMRMLRTVDTKAGLLAVAGATSASLHHDDPNRMAGYNLYEFGERGALMSRSARSIRASQQGAMRLPPPQPERPLRAIVRAEMLRNPARALIVRTPG